MKFDFNKLQEFNNKYPDNQVTTLECLLLSMLDSDSLPDEYLKDFVGDWSVAYEYLEAKDLIKITGDGIRDISFRPLGRELLGFETVDNLKILAEKMRDLFPSKIRSGGYLVRSSLNDTVDKLKKFFKKHNYTYEQVLKATEKYVKKKEHENYAYMQTLVYFIEKNGISNLASECDNLLDSQEDSILLRDDRL
jgi:hypothetical protein